MVSHLDVPVALLKNDTQTNANYLAVQLYGTRCERDAHGARVTVSDRATTDDLESALAEVSDLIEAGTLRLHLGGHEDPDFTRATVHFSIGPPVAAVSSYSESSSSASSEARSRRWLCMTQTDE